MTPGRGLCLFGGTFDPPHCSHHRVAAAALRLLRPERLVVIPCGDHPLKARPDPVSAADRVAMCRLAFADLPDTEVSTLEVDRPGPSFTVDTVRHFRSRIGLDEPLLLLIGSDNLGQLDRWHEHETLFELATLVTFPRRGYPITDRALRDVAIRALHKRHLLDRALADLEADDVSSSELRARLSRAAPTPEVAPAVLAYVRQHGLYRTSPPGTG